MTRHPFRIATHLTEADFMRQVTEFAELRGWSWAHFRPAMTSKGWRTPVSGPLGKGWPDLFLVDEVNVRRLAVELKSDGGRISPEQSWVMGVLEAAGIECYFWRPADWETIERVLR